MRMTWVCDMQQAKVMCATKQAPTEVHLHRYLQDSCALIAGPAISRAHVRTSSLGATILLHKPHGRIEIMIML